MVRKLKIILIVSGVTSLPGLLKVSRGASHYIWGFWTALATTCHRYEQGIKKKNQKFVRSCHPCEFQGSEKLIQNKPVNSVSFRKAARSWLLPKVNTERLRSWATTRSPAGERCNRASRRSCKCRAPFPRTFGCPSRLIPFANFPNQNNWD